MKRLSPTQSVAPTTRVARQGRRSATWRPAYRDPAKQAGQGRAERPRWGQGMLAETTLTIEAPVLLKALLHHFSSSECARWGCGLGSGQGHSSWCGPPRLLEQLAQADFDVDATTKIKITPSKQLLWS